MQDSHFHNILGQDLPSLLELAKKLESNIAPVLANVSKNRSQIDPKLMVRFDEAMNDLSKTREQVKKYGNFDSK